MNNEFHNHKFAYFFAFFILGTVTNIGYTVICTASQDLARKFGYENQMAVFNLACMITGISFKFINSKWLLGVSHSKKIIVVGFGILVGWSFVVGGSFCHDDENPENSRDGLGFALT
jgi:hypothetical protein